MDRRDAAWLPVIARALAVSLVAAIGTAHADDAVPAWSVARLWLGIEVGVPGQGSGLPIHGEHVPGGIAARYVLAPWSLVEPAIIAGIGPTVAGVGLGGWFGLELRHTLAGHLAITATPGVRTGFVGTLYYARRSDVFVGYDYLYGGPWTIAPRVAVGLATPIMRERLELYLDGFVEEPLLPTPQTLVGADLGIRIRL
jgi:hypothetical protein